MINPFTKVLVGTDFSAPGARAIERAVDVASRYGAKVHVVHVWEMPIITGGALAELSVDWIAPIEKAAQAQLDDLVALLRAGGTEVASSLCCGVPWDEILALVDHVHADLVVVGTHGRTGLSRALMGSVAERVVRLSPVPVLTIH